MIFFTIVWKTVEFEEKYSETQLPVLKASQKTFGKESRKQEKLTYFRKIFHFQSKKYMAVKLYEFQDQFMTDTF